MISGKKKRTRLTPLNSESDENSIFIPCLGTFTNFISSSNDASTSLPASPYGIMESSVQQAAPHPFSTSPSLFSTLNSSCSNSTVKNNCYSPLSMCSQQQKLQEQQDQASSSLNTLAKSVSNEMSSSKMYVSCSQLVSSAHQSDNIIKDNSVIKLGRTLSKTLPLESITKMASPLQSNLTTTGVVVRPQQILQKQKLLSCRQAISATNVNSILSKENDKTIIVASAPPMEAPRAVKESLSPHKSYTMPFVSFNYQDMDNEHRQKMSLCGGMATTNPSHFTSLPSSAHVKIPSRFFGSTQEKGESLSEKLNGTVGQTRGVALSVATAIPTATPVSIRPSKFLVMKGFTRKRRHNSGTPNTSFPFDSRRDINQQLLPSPSTVVSYEGSNHTEKIHIPQAQNIISLMTTDDDSLFQWNNPSLPESLQKDQEHHLQLCEEDPEIYEYNSNSNNIEDDNNVNKSVHAAEHNFYGAPFYGLPESIWELYRQRGIKKLYDWQDYVLTCQSIVEGKNFIYSLPTSGGKSLVAEIVLLRSLLRFNKSVILVSPFVSLAEEKMAILRPVAELLGVNLEGYYSSHGRMPPSALVSIFIATIEKANALFNSFCEDGRHKALGCIVVDELHMVGDGSRGAILEIFLSKVRLVTTETQIVGMSATVNNLMEMAEWLGADCYMNDYRPVPIQESIIYNGRVLKREELYITEATLGVKSAAKLPTATNTTLSLSTENISKPTQTTTCPSGVIGDAESILIKKNVISEPPSYCSDGYQEDHSTIMSLLLGVELSAICSTLDGNKSNGSVPAFSSFTWLNNNNNNNSPHVRCSSLVFCASRNMCVEYSMQIARTLDRLANTSMENAVLSDNTVFSESSVETTNACRRFVFANEINCNNKNTSIFYKDPRCEALAENLRGMSAESVNLCKIVPYGVAYHTAALLMEEREMIEQAFKEKILTVVCCTSTLAAGVNLPARRIIIKSPYIGREFLTKTKYMQMCGRAGRAGFDDHGETFLVLSKKNFAKGTRLIDVEVESVTSTLFSDRYGFTRAVLEFIDIGIFRETTKSALNIWKNALLAHHTGQMIPVLLLKEALRMTEASLLFGGEGLTNNMEITDSGKLRAKKIAEPALAIRDGAEENSMATHIMRLLEVDQELIKKTTVSERMVEKNFAELAMEVNIAEQEDTSISTTAVNQSAVVPKYLSQGGHMPNILLELPTDESHVRWSRYSDITLDDDAQVTLNTTSFTSLSQLGKGETVPPHLHGEIALSHPSLGTDTSLGVSPLQISAEKNNSNNNNNNIENVEIKKKLCEYDNPPDNVRDSIDNYGNQDLDTITLLIQASLVSMERVGMITCKMLTEEFLASDRAGEGSSSSSPYVESITNDNINNNKTKEKCIRESSGNISENELKKRLVNPPHRALGSFPSSTPTYRLALTSFGKSAVKGSLGIDEAMTLKEELQKLQTDGMILADDLHACYHVTPIRHGMNAISWEKYYGLLCSLNTVRHRIAGMLGLEEGYVMARARGYLRDVDPDDSNISLLQRRQQYVSRRFFHALALSDIVNEVPSHTIEVRYHLGVSEQCALLRSASIFSSSVVSFCESMGWFSLQAVFTSMLKRLGFGTRPDIVPLMEIEGVKAAKARLLYEAGYRTPERIATAEISDLFHKVKNVASPNSHFAKYFSVRSAVALIKAANKLVQQRIKNKKTEIIELEMKPRVLENQVGERGQEGLFEQG